MFSVPPETFLFIIVIEIAEMVPDDLVVRAPGAAEGGVGVVQETERAPAKDGEEGSARASVPGVCVARVEDYKRGGIGGEELGGEENAGDIEDDLLGVSAHYKKEKRVREERDGAETS